jgi:tRNA A-37 threonylcarbamoyl transferase component Bud32
VTEPFASGRDADVFLLPDDRRVLRRYRDGGSVAAEVEVMAFVAAHGYPVPTVYDVAGADVVMERLDGPTMTDAFLAGQLTIDAGSTILADLVDRLHVLPPRPGSAAGDGVIHLDLHPENVMLASRGPVVIDWRNATDGPADLDTALSALILAQVAVDGDDARATAARALLAGFLAKVEGDPLRLLDAAVERRGQDDNMSAVEIERLPSAAALVRDLARPV